MKRLTRVAVMAALIAGTSSVAFIAPANAQKEKKQKKEAPLKFSKEVIASASKIDVAAKARDAATGDAKTAANAAFIAALDANLPALEAAAKTDDERYLAQIYSFQSQALRIAAGGNENGLAAPLDALIANPRTPRDTIGRFMFLRGNIAYNMKQYPQAVALYNNARAAGFANADLQLLTARAKILGGDPSGGVADIEASVAAEKAAGRVVPEDMYTYAITALQKTSDTAATQRWTRNWLHAYGTPKNWRTAIYVFGFQGAGAARIDKRQRVDLFRLMRATKALANEGDYVEYADMAFSIGLGSETQTVLTEGKASGKITGSNRSVTELSADAAQQVSTEGTLAVQEKKAIAAPNGKLAADTGDFCLGNGNYAKAVEMYRLALSKGSVDTDEVNTHLGIALASSGDKAGAKTAFQAVKTAPRSEIATLWMTWIEAPAA